VPEQLSTSISRRTTLVLLGGATAVAAGGCSVGSTVDSLRPAPLPTPSAPANPDRAVVDRVAAAVAAADVGAPGAFARLHQRQLRALGPSRAPGKASGSGPWQRRQQGLVDKLTRAAVDADDPDLVRLLASMTAGQRQLLSARGLA